VSVIHEIERTCGVFLLYNRCPRIKEAFVEVWGAVDNDMDFQVIVGDRFMGGICAKVGETVEHIGEDNG